jgi:hypothetical protein
MKLTPLQKMIARGDEQPRQLGLAWALGVDTLYKFKGFAGEQRDHVIDMITNARIYFSRAEQFNDPLDVAPVIALGGDPKDPKFVEALEAKELEMMRSKGMADAEIDAYRKTNGSDIFALAAGSRVAVRKAIREATRIFCLSAEQCHPLQWSHYADQHRGLCLHFSSAPGVPFGLSRKVTYSQDRKPILIPLDRQQESAIFDRFVMVKADFWSYEHEFRIVVGPGVDWGGSLDGDFVSFDPDRLTGVTIGMRMPARDEAELVALIHAQRPHMKIWRAVEDFDRFWMHIEEVQQQ